MGSFARQLVVIFALHVLVVLAALGFGMRAGWTMEFCFEDGDGLIAALATRYGEADIGGGQVSAGTILRIFTSPDGGTFTIMRMATDGSACIIASGTYLEFAPPTLPHPDEKES